MKVKYLKVQEAKKIGMLSFPSFSSTGSIKGMKALYYGKNALLVKSGSYIYNVTSKPHIYYNLAK